MQGDSRYHAIQADTKIICDSFGLFLCHVVELVSSETRDIEKAITTRSRDQAITSF
jgi:hypothetical protein